MTSFTITFEDRIATVHFERPPVNSMLKETYAEMRDVFRTLSETDNADVAVFKSTGRFFCPGNEVSDFLKIEDGDAASEYGQAVSEGLTAIYDCRIPVIAAVHGHAFGAGMAMAACCDVLIAADDAQFAIPEIKVGVIGAAGFLNLIAPEKVVRYMSLTGEPISAQELAQYGGVHKVVPKEQVYAEAEKAARAMLKNGPTALRYFKEAMNINQRADLAGQYATESSFNKKLVGSAESKEAAKAFLEKRPPDFKR